MDFIIIIIIIIIINALFYQGFSSVFVPIGKCSSHTLEFPLVKFK